MSDAIAGMGTTLKRDGHIIAEVTKIGAPEIKLETKEVTHLTSPDDFKEFIGTLFEAGEVPIEGSFIAGDVDGQIALMADQANKTKQSFVITFPTAITATWTFTALVTNFKIGDYNTTGESSFSATLKISGKPVLAIGESTGPSALVVTGNVSGPLSLTPAYDDEKYAYIADGSGDASVTVTVTAAGAASIKVNGSAVSSGVPSAAITLTPDNITTLTIVVTDTGKVSKTYVISVGGPAS
jgi:hypothetical protein